MRQTETAGALGDGQPAGKTLTETIPHFVSMADLGAIQPYNGPLGDVTFGDPSGAHVVVILGNLTVTLNEGHREWYWIDLERCVTPAQLLDWVFQVQGKTWMTPELLRVTVEALDCALYPQATLCSCGIPKNIRKSDLRRLVEGRLRERIGWELAYPGRIRITRGVAA
jgi:hypothetical protein